jgi:hypothetical protein
MMSKPIHKPRRVSELCKDLLPADFRQRRSRIDQYQHFFKSLESDAVFAMVEVINVSDDLLTLALPSSALVNYLRLHQEYLTAAIEQQFGHTPALKMIVAPGGRPESGDGRGSLAHANPVSQRARDQIRAGADLVEDEELRDALHSLAKHLKTEHD